MDENLIYGECQPPQGRGFPRNWERGGGGGYMLTFSLKMSHFLVIRHCAVSKGVSPKFPLIVTISVVLQYALGIIRTEQVRFIDLYSVNLLYLSVIARAVIGQLSESYFTLRHAKI